MIQITARDLFPTGCVALAGIRPVGKERIDQAITYAASILAEGSPTLRDVFLGMIGDNRKLLSKVDELKTFYRKGYVGLDRRHPGAGGQPRPDAGLRHQDPQPGI